MPHVDWSPKGGDGAFAEESGAIKNEDGMPTDAQIDDAVAVFVTIAGAVVNEEMELAAVIWQGFCYRLGSQFDPFAMFVHAGIISAATAIRVLCGDPDPEGPPSGDTSLLALATDRDTGEPVEMEEIELAATLIGHACNWEWDKVSEAVQAKTEDMEDVAHAEFLRSLGAALMSMFVGVGGLESARRGT